MRWEYIVDGAEMQRADKNTIEHFKVPQLVLMERAALAAREAAWRRWPELSGKKARILIACGNGNNGGDGAALARLFFLAGCDVTVLISGDAEKYSAALGMQMEILGRYKEDADRFGQGELRIMTDGEWLCIYGRPGREEIEPLLGYDLVTDALFGIGLSREITGIYQEKIQWLNGLSGRKMALDIPSGLSAGNGVVLGCAFRADITVTFGFCKRGMLLYPAREICGETIVSDIGITKESFLGKFPAGVTAGRTDGGGGICGEKKALSKCVVRRRPDGHKGSFGKVLLVAGSAGTPGAALLAGEAVLRSGAGMLQIVSPAENRDLILTGLPEAMYRALSGDTGWASLLDWCDAVVVGPGIGKGPEAEEAIEKIMTIVSEKPPLRPVVLDADGLNLTAVSGELFERIKRYTAAGGTVIMTPHMMEFARLLRSNSPGLPGEDMSCLPMEQLKRQRLELLENYVRESGAILVSKDAATVVGFADSAGSFHYYINQTGNSGMATAGSGDVLSGIVGAMAAFTAVNRKKEEDIPETKAYFRTVCRAVYLHGLAGDKAAWKYGEESMKAGDIIRMLPEVLTGGEIPDWEEPGKIRRKTEG